MNQNELNHYGVLGMKWGVRRNANILSSYRKNVKQDEARNAYKLGKITKEERKDRFRAAKNEKKTYEKKVKSDLKTLKDKKKVEKYSKHMKMTTAKEVPYDSLKRGARIVNEILTGVNVGTSALGTVAVTTIGGPAIGSLVAAESLVATYATYKIRKEFGNTLNRDYKKLK